MRQNCMNAVRFQHFERYFIHPSICVTIGKQPFVSVKWQLITHHSLSIHVQWCKAMLFAKLSHAGADPNGNNALVPCTSLTYYNVFN